MRVKSSSLAVAFISFLSKAGWFVLFFLITLVVARPAAADPACVAGPHTGTLSVSQEWCVIHNPHIVNGYVTIPNGVTLTIEDGVVVQFTSSGMLNVEGGGTLLIQGTSGQGVIFTSTASPPAPGNWRGVRVQTGGHLNADYLDLAYAGQTDNVSLEVQASDVQVRHSRIHHGQGVGLWLSGNNLTPTFEDVEVDHCTTYALYQTTPNMRPTYAGLNIHDNGTDALLIYSAPFLTQAVTWSSSNLGGVPIDLTHDLIIDSGGVLTVTAGTTVRLSTGKVQVRAGGALYAPGAASEPVRFTSQAASPAPGNWWGIQVWQAGARFWADYLDLAYAGRADNRSLDVRSSDVQVRHSRIHHGQGMGLWVEGNNLTPTFEDVEVDHCTTYALYQTTLNMRPTYAGLNIHDNGTDALLIYSAPFLTQAVTWSGPGLGGAPIDLTHDLIVDSGGVLTMTAGTTLRLASGKAVQLRGTGAFYAMGTDVNPVYVTSQLASPTPGSWWGVEMKDATARLYAEHLDLAYAGQNSLGSLFIRGSDVSIEHSRIHHGEGTGIAVLGAGLTATFRDIEIDHCTGPAFVRTRLDQNLTIEGIWPHDNGFDGLQIMHDDILYSPVVLDTEGFLGPRVVRIASNDIAVGPGGSLTITPGLTLEFDEYGIYLFGGGSLFAVGTVTQPITLTSAFAEKEPGQWDGLSVMGSSQARLAYCDIGYAGKWHSALHIWGCDDPPELPDVEIVHCRIHHSAVAGIYVDGLAQGSRVRLERSAITDNETGLEIRGSLPWALTLVRNTFERNATYGIYYDGGLTVDARYHYWGHPSGPYHPTQNPMGLGDRVSNGVLFIPWIETFSNVTAPPELVSPTPDEVLSELPLRFRLVSRDPDETQRLRYIVEILQGGTQQYLFDQRTSTDGWDRTSYDPGVTATLTLRDVLPNGAYTWRAAVFDGMEEVWSSEERPFTVTLAVNFAVTGLTPEETLGAPITKTFTVHGLGFVSGLAQVRVERRLWNDTIETLTPFDAQVLSPSQITFKLNLTGASGPWEVIVAQGASEGRTPLFIYPYMPMFGYAYANPESLRPDAAQVHWLSLTNFGSADGVAIVGLYGPKYASLTVPAQAGVEYLGKPAPRTYLLAVQVAAGASRDVYVHWTIPWSAVNQPGYPNDPALYDRGDPLRYKFAVIGQLSTQAWSTLKAQAPGDLAQQVYLAAWGGALAEGWAADAYLEGKDRALASDYIERLGVVYPFVADALVLRQYNDFALALYDAIDYPLPGPSASEMGVMAQNGWFASWVERAIGDPWEFTKAFFTGFDDVITSGQAGAFLVAEAEGLVEGLTFGLFRPSFGAKAMAHVSGLDPSAIGIGRFIGNMLSIPIGPGIGKVFGKGVGNLLCKAHTALKPTEDIYFAWNKLKFTIAGNAGEPQRWGLSVISKGRDLPLIHWGNNPKFGGFHWAFGWEGKPVSGVAPGRLGEELYGAGLHFYENHMYAPKAFLTGVPFLHGIEEQALRQYFNVIKESTFAAIKLGQADIGDHLFPPAVPPQDDSLCNQGAQKLNFSWDPNAIEGTPRMSHITPFQEIGLMVHFENLITATLPAENITVTLPIHPNLDWASIRLAGMSHAGTVQANPAARTITWAFQGINLPPNVNPPEGEGWVRIMVYPSATLTTGQQITETAKIVFDTNPPMWTNVITYTIDLTPPAIDLGFQEVAGPWVRAVMTATDNIGGSGVALAGLEYSADGENWVQGPYIPIITPTEVVSGTFHFGNVEGGHYWLRAFARDDVGNTAPLTDPIEVDLPWGLRMPLLRSEQP